MAQEPMERIDSGMSLGHYRILNRIGEGGMGQVWLASDERLGRSVAVKVLPPETTIDEAHLSRFIQEARLASSLNHPNIRTYTTSATRARCLHRHGVR